MNMLIFSYNTHSRSYKVLVTLVLIIMFSAMYTLFIIKYNARRKHKELHKIEAMIREEEQNIKLLTVDFEHLSRPQQLRELMFLTTNLEPVKTTQIIVLKDE